MFVVSLTGISKDELFGQFFEVLEKVHYFKTMPDGNDDQGQLDRATRIFHNAIEVSNALIIYYQSTVNMNLYTKMSLLISVY